MKKKILEKDGFYLSLFVCVCLIAVGGVWFTNSKVDKLASNKEIVNNKDKSSEDEIHLIEKNKEGAIPTATDSDHNLSKAKAKNEQETSKLSFIGNKVIRGYSEKEPSYSKTLDVWEIHKGIDVSTNKGQDIKSLLKGTVVDVFKDDKYGMSVKLKCENNIILVYSNLNKDVKVEKNQKIEEGQCIGLAGNTSTNESEEGQHIHLEAFKGEKSIDPMSLIK
ncbi:M23 family peptidase [Romboutsia maritimum]|uniref:M23 family peptidase n=1 Tax=Romboutsia maritimum TaxID=2020948 RepID=A0A371IQT1_9FIRM|nr:M23 family metallopeptidase [Romboutsia maritimum]RDY22823.1 M23 family peptidase [Romboutsia maritimum]